MVIGAGYVGLVTAACLSFKHHTVTVVEQDTKKIEILQKGSVPFYEPGLANLVQNSIAEGTISFASSIEEGLAKKPQVVFSCVGTPSAPDGTVDLSYVYAVADDIGNHLEDYALIVNKSTVPVGTAEQVRTRIKTKLAARKKQVSFDVASNPEFLKEGTALNDFLVPDRVVVGVDCTRARSLLYEIYKPFLTSPEQFIVMQIPSAELTKYAANSMLAMRISFINELALLADKVGADIVQVKQGIASDSRIGKAFLNAGVGYGGSCFPKDVQGLYATGAFHDEPMTLSKATHAVNCYVRREFIDMVADHYKGNTKGKHIGVWGVSFKPETDDIRYAPAIDGIKQFLAQGMKVTVYDPIAAGNALAIFGDAISFAASPQEILEHCDSLVIFTEWSLFRRFEIHDFLTLKDKVVFDGRNCFDPRKMSQAGITYYCIGRRSLTHERAQDDVALTRAPLPDRWENQW